MNIPDALQSQYERVSGRANSSSRSQESRDYNAGLAKNIESIGKSPTQFSSKTSFKPFLSALGRLDTVGSVVNNLQSLSRKKNTGCLTLSGVPDYVPNLNTRSRSLQSGPVSSLDYAATDENVDHCRKSSCVPEGRSHCSSCNEMQEGIWNSLKAVVDPNTTPDMMHYHAKNLMTGIYHLSRHLYSRGLDNKSHSNSNYSMCAGKHGRAADLLEVARGVLDKAYQKVGGIHDDERGL